MTTQPAPEEPKKSKTGKILLGCGIAVLVSLILMAGCAYWMFKDAFTKDPAKVAEMTAEIAPGAKIPSGYEGQFGIDIMGFTMVFIAPPGTLDDGGNNVTMMVLARAPAGNRAQIEAQMKDKLDEETGKGGGTTEKIGTETFRVGGRDVEFDKSRVVKDGNNTIQYSGVLETGGSNVAMLMFMGPEEGFDRAAMDALLASIDDVGGDAPAGNGPAEDAPPAPDGSGDGN